MMRRVWNEGRRKSSIPLFITQPNTLDHNTYYCFKLTQPNRTYNKMQSLLRWSIENSTPLDSSSSNSSAPTDRAPPVVEHKNLDPAIIDMILGKPDAELMKEDMSIAVDANRSEDDRINALDHLEMVFLFFSFLIFYPARL